MVNILATTTADQGSILSSGKSDSHQTISGTALARNWHSVVYRTDLSTATQLVQCLGTLTFCFIFAEFLDLD